jgi:hypothetical protein
MQVTEPSPEGFLFGLNNWPIAALSSDGELNEQNRDSRTQDSTSGTLATLSTH